MEAFTPENSNIDSNTCASSDKNLAVVTDFKKPYLTELDMRKPKKGECMVKVYSAPVNPSDNYFVVGMYGNIKKFKTLPVGAGFSGAGIIVEVGEGVSEKLVGKRIAISHMPSNPGYIGTFRQYTFVNAQTVFPFPEELSFDDIANAMGANPITIAGFMDIAERHGHTCFINDAAASSLGKMFNRYCNSHGNVLINIVRKESQVEILKDMGAKIVLNSSDPKFYDDLKRVIKYHKPTAFFDAIGGDFPGTVLALMPDGSTMYVYGALSNKQHVTADGGGLIFKNHTVSNFWIPTWLKMTKKDVLRKWMEYIIKDLMEGGSIFGTYVSKTYPLSEWDKALKYSQENATEGKVVIRPQE